MVGEAIAGLSAIKTAFDLAKGLKDISDTALRNAAVIELQEKILAAQQAQATLVERVGELEKEVTRLKDWEAEKQRYELVNIGSGVVALSLKAAMRNGEPAHYICADCASGGKKHHLQRHISGPNYDQYKCNGCKFEIGISKGTPSAPRQPRMSSNWDV